MSKKTSFSIIVLFWSLMSCASLNDVNKGIQQFGGVVRQGTIAVTELQRLTNTLKMSKTEFDKTVKVFQSGDAATNRKSVPAGKLAKFEVKRGKESG